VFVHLLVTAISPTKQLNQSRCHLGIDSGGSKEACIRWGTGSLQGKDNFWGDIAQPIVKCREYLVCC